MKLATALLLVVCVATACVALPLSAVGGCLTPEIGWLGLAAGVVAAVAYWLTSGSGGRPLKMGWMEWSAAALFAIFALRAFCWVVFKNEDNLDVLSPNNLGDLSLHLTFIRYMARGAQFWPENPIYSGVKLHYPVGIDIFNALLSVIGCDDYRAIIWVALAGSAVTCYALLRWGRWFAAIGFLCNGGLIGFKFFHHLSFQIADYQADLAWKSIPLAMLVTQRGLLYAIPAGLLLLATWRAQWFRADDDPAPAVRMPLWVQVLLYGIMPLFHMHTFLFLSALLGYWLAVGKPGIKLRMQVLDLVLWAIFPATACVVLVTGLFQRGQENAAHIIHYKLGWMQDGENFFRFWYLENFGILPLLTLALLVWAVVCFFRKRETGAGAFYFVIPCISVFLVACYVMFAPWEWDNTKLMIWCYLGILPFLHEMLLAEIPGRLGLPVRALIYLALFFSGFISLIGGIDKTHRGYSIGQLSELDAVARAVHDLPPDSTFAGWPTFNHPLLMCGCKMVEGYDGHLMSHGINYQGRLDKLTSMMMGSPDWRDIASSLHVRYLFWGSRELAAYPESTEPWRGYPVVASGEWGSIYDLEGK